MTETQLNLLGPPTPPVKLTLRQRAVLLQLRAGTAPMEVDEAGAIAHELKTGRWAHSSDSRCDYCGQEGRSILEALVAKGLAERKRPGRGSIVYAPVIPDPDPLADQPDFAALAAATHRELPDLPVSQGGYGQLPEGF